MLDSQTLLQLSEKQAQLDNFIYRNRHLAITPELIDKKLIAFFVELGEYANEERSFKYWSEKLPAPRARQLDEYIDGLHFLLSLGNDFGYDFEDFHFIEPLGKTIVEQYFAILEACQPLLTSRHGVFNLQTARHLYQKILNAYFGLAYLSDYQPQELIDAYHKKHEINFQRQHQHY